MDTRRGRHRLSRVVMTEPPYDDARGAIGGRTEQFVMRMSFPFLSLKQVGFLSGLIITGPGSKYACFIYSDEDHVEEILSVHQRAPNTIRDEPSASNVQRIVHPACPLFFGGRSSAILKEFTRMAPRFRGSHSPLRVLWIR